MSAEPPGRRRPEVDDLTTGVVVAIVDTGIDTSHPRVGPVRDGTAIVLSSDGSPRFSDRFQDDFGHGTACAGLVRRIAPAAELLAIKVASETRQIPAATLVAAIHWAIDRGADVINLSLGTTSTRPSSDLERACLRARDAGVVVVCAEDNEGRVSYPAAFESVIAVTGSAEERAPLAFRFDRGCQRRFATYGGHQRLCWVSPRNLLAEGNSFAAARFSAIVAHLRPTLGRLLPWSHLLEKLREKALGPSPTAPTPVNTKRSAGPPSPVASPSRNIDWIRTAALYPFSKEMHSLIRFSHLLPFRLVAVADPVMRGNLGKDASALLGLPARGLTITSDVGRALEHADTLILGFSSFLGALRSRDIKNELIRQALDLGKNVYTFEAPDAGQQGVLLEHAAARRLHLGWPAVTNEDLEALRITTDPTTNSGHIPTLGVFGTGRSQGKFTIQLILREVLKKLGYNVAQIGSEHQSRLFEMDACFPYGHLSNISVRTQFWFEYLHLTYKRIQELKAPDLILVGSQGGIVPYHATDRHSRSFNVYLSLLFLRATQCDSFILTVNHLDDAESIQDALDLLRIIGNGVPIMLALSSIKKSTVESFGRILIAHEPISPAEQASHIRRLEELFHLPVVSILSRSAPDQMVEHIVERYRGRDEAAKSNRSASATRRGFSDALGGETPINETGSSS